MSKIRVPVHQTFGTDQVTATTSSQFVDNLVDSGLMSREAIDKFTSSIAAEKRPDNAQDLAKLLVRKGRLTKYQASCIYQGRTKNLVIGDYVIQDRLGEGGMGVVFRAEHRKMKRTVAFKILPREMMRRDGAVERFYQEVQAAAKLNHANIVTAYDAGEVGKIHYLAMELVDGDDLESIVVDNGPMSVVEALEVIQQVAAGLMYAHDSGIIHRDIKPSNLLLDREGTVKILDMGLARIVLGDSAADETAAMAITGTGMMMGTVDYLSPEQAEDAHRADHRTDIYALGCTMYKLLTGSPPFRADTIVKAIKMHEQAAIPSLVQARGDAPLRLDGVFSKMVAKRPKRRHQSMHEVLLDLEACYNDALAASSKPNRESALTHFFDNLDSGKPDTTKALEETLDPQPPASVQPTVVASVEPARPMANKERARRRTNNKLIPLVSSIVAVCFLALCGLGYVLVSGSGSGNNDGRVGNAHQLLDEIKTEHNTLDPPRSNDVVGNANTTEDDAAGIAGLVRIATELGGRVLVWNDEARHHTVLTSETEAIDRGAGITLTFKDVKTFDDSQLARVHRQCKQWNEEGPMSFDLSGTRVTSSGVAALSDLTVISLVLNRNQEIDDRLAGGFSSFTRLKTLSLQETGISDSTINALPKLKSLRVLNVRSTHVTPTSIRGLLSLDFERLDISRTQYGQAEVDRIRATMPDCDVNWDGAGNADVIAGGRRAEQSSDAGGETDTMSSARDGSYFVTLKGAGEVSSPRFLLPSSDARTFELFVRVDKSPPDGGSFQILGYDEISVRFGGFSWALSVSEPKRKHWVEGRVAAKTQTWQHVAVTTTRDRQRLYVDGNLQAECNASLSLGDRNSSFLVGAGAGESSLQGAVKSVRVSNTLRYEKVFQPPRTLTDDSDTIVLYDFHEGTGNVLHDVSGNGHHGKVIGMTWEK